MRKHKLGSLMIAILMILINFIWVISPIYACQSIPSNAVELRVGIDMAGTSDLTLDGVVSVPIGCLCEVRNASSDAVIDSFYIGHGTEGPPGTFKAGQFDFILTVSPNPYESRTLDVFIRIYDASSVESATSYGDSQQMTVSGGTIYNLSGWVLSENMSEPGDPNNGSSTDTNGDPIVPTPFWKNPLFIVIIISIVVLVCAYLFTKKSKAKEETVEKVITRRRNSNKKRR